MAPLSVSPRHARRLSLPGLHVTTHRQLRTAARSIQSAFRVYGVARMGLRWRRKRSAQRPTRTGGLGTARRLALAALSAARPRLRLRMVRGLVGLVGLVRLAVHREVVRQVQVLKDKDKGSQEPKVPSNLNKPAEPSFRPQPWHLALHRWFESARSAVSRVARSSAQLRPVRRPMLRFDRISLLALCPRHKSCRRV